MRTPEDCRFIAGAVISSEGSSVDLALLFGLLCGAYMKLPDSLFWDICVQFIAKKYSMKDVIR